MVYGCGSNWIFRYGTSNNIKWIEHRDSTKLIELVEKQNWKKKTTVRVS